MPAAGAAPASRATITAGDITAGDITGMVLAGGEGRRMGGVDKGLQTFRGAPLARHALLRLAPQVGRVAVNANRYLADYRRWGVPLWSDARVAGKEAVDNAGGFAGPLAGFLAGLTACTTPWLLTVPCDSPRFPADLAVRLAAAATASGADIAVASALDAATGDYRPQPVFCLLRADLRPSLAAFLDDGGRKAGAWMARHARVDVRFDRATDDPLAFFNANTLDELRSLESTEPMKSPGG